MRHGERAARQDMRREGREQRLDGFKPKTSRNTFDSGLLSQAPPLFNPQASCHVFSLG